MSISRKAKVGVGLCSLIKIKKKDTHVLLIHFADSINCLSICLPCWLAGSLRVRISSDLCPKLPAQGLVQRSCQGSCTEKISVTTQPVLRVPRVDCRSLGSSSTALGLSGARNEILTD